MPRRLPKVAGMQVTQSAKLANVCYDIRGPVLHQAKQMEAEGHRILKLNIGNPAPFGFEAPEEILQDVILNLHAAHGYGDSKGLLSARRAVVQYYQQKGLGGVDIEDVYLGNGVSELIVMAMQALLDNGDEVLIPAPDYPLWTAAVSLSGGRPVHYLCDEQAAWFPDLDDIAAKITDRTRALVIINPNNPTGAVYSTEVLEGLVEIARRHNLVVLSAESYVEGLEILANMRLCPNMPSQFAVQTALGGHQSINDLVLPGGRLVEQRDRAWELLNEIPGVSCVKPSGALYAFPRLDPAMYPIVDDEKFVLDLLMQERLLVVQGTGFNWPRPDHFRVVTLPRVADLEDAIGRIARFLRTYRQ